MGGTLSVMQLSFNIEKEYLLPYSRYQSEKVFV